MKIRAIRKIPNTIKKSVVVLINSLPSPIKNVKYFLHFYHNKYILNVKSFYILKIIERIRIANLYLIYFSSTLSATFTISSFERAADILNMVVLSSEYHTITLFSSFASAS